MNSNPVKLLLQVARHCIPLQGLKFRNRIIPGMLKKTGSDRKLARREDSAILLIIAIMACSCSVAILKLTAESEDTTKIASGAKEILRSQRVRDRLTQEEVDSVRSAVQSITELVSGTIRKMKERSSRQLTDRR